MHALFVHFPVALLGTSLVFDGIGFLLDKELWWQISYGNIALGLAAGAFAVMTGLFDSLKLEERSRAAKIANRHLVVMLGALTCYGMVLAVRPFEGLPLGSVRVASLGLEAAGLVLLLIGGWLGGELVYRHGVGRIES
jgi:uncharacterized membrane protein